MFTLWTLIEASLLCLNAVCVLHEERFLAKGWYSYKFQVSILKHLDILVGWGGQQMHQEFGQPTAKAQMLNLIRSIRTVAKS